MDEWKPISERQWKTLDLPRRKAMAEWQPIETAPTEGRFLVYGGTWISEENLEWRIPSGVALVQADENSVIREQRSPFSRPPARYYSPADGDYSGGGFAPYIKNPTHWMPVPAPPGG
jgi:hypothetical protein